jgi:multisubunit Na+/H+ antiporter MnhB subunit
MLLATAPIALVGGGRPTGGVIGYVIIAVVFVLLVIGRFMWNRRR